MRYLDRLAGDLAAAAAKGVLSSEQARKVRDLAGARLEASKIRGVTWIALFAGSSIAAGLSLIIAHNWDKIPALAKIAVYLTALAASGAATLWTQEGKNSSKGVAVEVLWLLLPLLGIGLYAQVFQLSGDPALPYLLWLALTALVAFGSARGVAPALHAAAGLAVLIFFSFYDEGSLSLHRLEFAQVRPTTWLWLAALIALISAEARERLDGRARVWACGGLLLWGALLSAFNTPFRLEDEALRTMVRTLAALAWAGLAPRLAGPGENRAPRLALIGALYFCTFVWHYRVHGPGHSDAGGLGLTVALLLAGAGGALIAFAPAGLIGSDPAWERGAKGLLAAAWLLALGLFIPSQAAYQSVAVGANVLIVLAGVGLMWHGSTTGRIGQINEGALALFALLVTRLIDVFGTFLEGGAAFIGMGLMLSGVAYALHHGRRVMVARAKGSEASL